MTRAPTKARGAHAGPKGARTVADDDVNWARSRALYEERARAARRGPRDQAHNVKRNPSNENPALPIGARAPGARTKSGVVVRAFVAAPPAAPTRRSESASAPPQIEPSTPGRAPDTRAQRPKPFEGDVPGLLGRGRVHGKGENCAPRLDTCAASGGNAGARSVCQKPRLPMDATAKPSKKRGRAESPAGGAGGPRPTHSGSKSGDRSRSRDASSRGKSRDAAGDDRRAATPKRPRPDSRPPREEATTMDPARVAKYLRGAEHLGSRGMKDKKLRGVLRRTSHKFRDAATAAARAELLLEHEAGCVAREKGGRGGDRSGAFLPGGGALAPHLRGEGLTHP